MDDLISRLSEMRSNYNCFDETEEPYYRALSEAIQLASAQPERTGKWIYGESECGNDGYYCDKCGNFVPWKYGEYDIDFIKEFLFCNKCGARMEGNDETD